MEVRIPALLLIKIWSDDCIQIYSHNCFPITQLRLDKLSHQASNVCRPPSRPGCLPHDIDQTLRQGPWIDGSRKREKEEKPTINLLNDFSHIHQLDHLILLSQGGLSWDRKIEGFLKSKGSLAGSRRNGEYTPLPIPSPLRKHYSLCMCDLFMPCVSKCVSQWEEENGDYFISQFSLLFFK